MKINKLAYKIAVATSSIIIAALILCVSLAPHMASAAVSQGSLLYIDGGLFYTPTIKDGAKGAAINNGVMPAIPYIYNGTRAEVATVGSQFYAVKRANITTASVNIAFGFPSKKISIETPTGNTDEICVDWGGGTAVCPAANTAGDDKVAAGRLIVLDDFVVTSISVIANTGTQTVYVRAWR